MEPGAIVTITSTFTNNDAVNAIIWDGSDDQYIPTGTITNGMSASVCVPSAGLNAFYTCVRPNGASFNTYSNGGLRMLMLPPGVTVCTLPARVCGNTGDVLPISSTYTVMNYPALTLTATLTAGAPTPIHNVRPTLTFASTFYPLLGMERTYKFSLTSTSVSTDPLTYTLTSTCPDNTQAFPQCTGPDSWECSQISPAQTGTLAPGESVADSLDLLICGGQLAGGTGTLTFTTTFSDDDGSTRTTTISLDSVHGFIEVNSPATTSTKLRGAQVVLQHPIS